MIALGGISLSPTAFADAPKPKYGPTGKPFATTLFSSHHYFQTAKHGAPDFWALIGYYVPQYNGAACSAASITMALNAARAGLAKTADDKLILQPELVEKTTTDHWKDRLSEAGFGPEKAHGVSLDKLREIAEAVFKENGFPHVQVTATHVHDLSKKTLDTLHAALVENEKSAGDFILANFNQKAFTDDSDAGHIAPVGAYDAETRRVLILDPDREWYEPYWVDEKKFAEGMNTKDSETSDDRGYITIQLDASSR
jgi:hypothetical protein